MRTLTKPSTALCTLDHYTAFLLAESQSAGLRAAWRKSAAGSSPTTRPTGFSTGSGSAPGTCSRKPVRS